ncbi:glycosyltransferase [Cuniculiplasma sp. SKW4]|uniref:glycosyltransferase n=1 Tax=Cuniculiplasma sp. SKW4 TaxID=3400171 RepID=UPI003FD10A10
MISEGLSIIIPAYNEEKRIGKILKDLMETVKGVYEIIIVFDGNDSTPEVAKSICTECRILTYNRKLGKGGAILEGINAANGEIIAYIDADGSVPAEELERLRKNIKKGEFVVSSRWVKGAKLEKRQTLKRIVLSRLFHYYVFGLLRIPIIDTQCGLKIFYAKDAKEIGKKVRVFDWTFDISMIFHGIKMGLSPREIGIKWKDSEGSKLKISKTVPAMFLTVLGIWARERYDKNDFIRVALDKIDRNLLNYSRKN